MADIWGSFAPTAIQMMCPITKVAIKTNGLTSKVPKNINMIGNWMPILSIVGKNGPHNIFGGLATALSITSRIVSIPALSLML